MATALAWMHRIAHQVPPTRAQCVNDEPENAGVEVFELLVPSEDAAMGFEAAEHPVISLSRPDCSRSQGILCGVTSRFCWP